MSLGSQYAGAFDINMAVRLLFTAVHLHHQVTNRELLPCAGCCGGGNGWPTPCGSGMLAALDDDCIIGPCKLVRDTSDFSCKQHFTNTLCPRKEKRPKRF